MGRHLIVRCHRVRAFRFQVSQARLGYCRRMLKRLSGMATAAALLCGFLMFIAPASATADDDGPFDLWGLTAKDLPVRSDSCRKVRVYARHNAPSWIDTVQVSVDVHSPSPDSGSEVFLEESSRGHLTGTFNYCPAYSDRGNVGTYRLGESEVSYYYDNDNRSGEFIDTSRGYFKIKQASRFVGLSAKRKGKTVTVSARPQFWSTGSFGEGSGWSPADQANQSKANVKRTAFYLQRRAANGYGPWRNVRRAVAPKTRTLSMKVTARKQFQYRICSDETARTFFSYSRIVRR